MTKFFRITIASLLALTCIGAPAFAQKSAGKAAKKAKDFAEADRIRDYLLNEKGIILKDTREGVKWSRA